jgi:hypothetical protein
LWVTITHHLKLNSCLITAGQRHGLILPLGFYVAWVATVGVLFDIRWSWLGKIRLGLSDLILVLCAFRIFSQRGLSESGSWQRLPYGWWLAAFGLITVIMGNLVAWLRLGYLPQWTIVNKDIGMIVILGSYYLIASAPGQPRLVPDLLNWFVISASILNVIALVGAAARYIWDIPNPLMDGWNSLRLAGAMINSNGYGGYLAAVLSVQLSAFVVKEGMFGIPRWIQGANCTALLLGLLFTISRGSWFAALAGILVIMLVTTAMLHRWHLRISDLVAPVLVSMVLFMVLVLTGLGGLTIAVQDYTVPRLSEAHPHLYAPYGPPSVAEFLRIASDPSGAADRIAINQIALKMYLESPWSILFGIGVGSFLEESAQTVLQTRILIHNVYLWVLVELGLLGFTVLIGLLLSKATGLLASLRGTKAPDYALMALLAALGSVLVRFLSSEASYQRYVWLILALVSLLVRERSDSHYTT